MLKNMKKCWVKTNTYKQKAKLPPDCSRCLKHWWQTAPPSAGWRHKHGAAPQRLSAAVAEPSISVGEEMLLHLIHTIFCLPSATLQHLLFLFSVCWLLIESQLLLWIQLCSQLTFFCPAAGCFRFSIVCDRQHLFSYMLLSCFFFPSSFLPSLPTPTSCIPLSFSLSFSTIFCNYLLRVNLRGSEATGDSSRPRLLLFYLPVFQLLFFPSPSSCFLFLPKHILPHLQLYSHVTLFIPDSCVRLLLLLFARLGLISESFLRRRWDTNRIWENLKVCWRFCKDVLRCKNSSVT